MKRPFVFIAIFLILGIASAKYAGCAAVLSLAILFAGAALIPILLRQQSMPFAVICLALSLLGASQFHIKSLIPQDHIARRLKPSPQKVILKGTVADDPAILGSRYGTPRERFLIRTMAVREGKEWLRSAGLVQVSIPYSGDGFDFGDEVVLEGELSAIRSLKNPGSFDRAGYYRNKSIFCRLKVPQRRLARKVARASFGIVPIAHKLRKYIGDAYDRYLPGQCGSFLKAVMIGERGDIDSSVNEDFIKTGTVHILSISGQHVAIIACMLLFLLRAAGCTRRASLIIASAFLVFYSFVAGLSPPIVRSVIMFCVLAAGYAMRRESDMLNTLMFAVFVILLYDPSQLFDPSLQLSAVSVASIIILAPKIDRVLLAEEIAPAYLRFAVKSASVSLAAWLGTWPIVAAYFNITSPISVLSNILIAPFVSILMAGGFAVALLSAISSHLPGIILPVLKIVSQGMFLLNHLLSSLPLAYARIPAPGAVLLVTYYALLIIAISNIAVRKSVVLVSLAICNIFSLENFAGLSSRPFEITYLDVGRGDAAFVRFPDGANMLIDTGDGGIEGEFDAARSVIAPYLWNKNIGRIDLVILTHLHADHAGGLKYLANNFDIKKVLGDGLRRGDLIDVGRYGTISVLNPERDMPPEDLNDRSTVLRLKCGRSVAVFCGDISMERYRDLSSGDGLNKADVIKLPHHKGITLPDGSFADTRRDGAVIVRWLNKGVLVKRIKRKN